MNPVTARTLNWLAGMLTVLAPAIISPAGTFPLLVLAVICAAIPALFASKRTRVVAVILLGISLPLAINCFPDFKREQARYYRLAKDKAATAQAILAKQRGIMAEVLT